MVARAALGKARTAVLAATMASARARGYDLVEQHFYSPLPDVERLPTGLWPDPLPTPGVDLRLESAVALLGQLTPLIEEFNPPREPQPGGGFYLHNSMYESVDAETLYALVRLLQPKRVVELGSGASSHVISRARADAGRAVEHHIYDPYPFTASGMGPVESTTVRAVGAEMMTADDLAMLEAGDILFVDTTHTVKTGGDCSNIYLRLLPTIPVGVYVHVHDIFMPYEYPRRWVVDHRRAWAEQYLMQAFLAFNKAFEVLLPTHALARLRTEAVAAAVSSFSPNVAPAAFWMRRCA